MQHQNTVVFILFLSWKDEKRRIGTTIHKLSTPTPHQSEQVQYTKKRNNVKGKNEETGIIFYCFYTNSAVFE